MDFKDALIRLENLEIQNKLLNIRLTRLEQQEQLRKDLLRLYEDLDRMFMTRSELENFLKNPIPELNNTKLSQQEKKDVKDNRRKVLEEIKNKIEEMKKEIADKSFEYNN
jgi:hypothetical protein